MWIFDLNAYSSLKVVKDTSAVILLYLVKVSGKLSCVPVGSFLEKARWLENVKAILDQWEKIDVKGENWFVTSSVREFKTQTMWCV